MTTTVDIAAKYGREVDDVKDALRALGYEKRLSVASKVSPDMEAKLDAYFLDSARPAAKDAVRPPSVRRIGGTQVTEKKVRTINRPKSRPAAAPRSAAPVAPPPEKTAPPKPDSAAVRAADELHKKQILAQQPKTAPPPPPPKDAAETPPPATTVKAAAAAEISAAAEKPAKAESPKSETGRGGTIKIDRAVVREREKRRRRGMTGGKRPPANLHGFKQPAGAVVRELPVPEFISVNRLAAEMSVKGGAIIRKLMEYGMEDANPNMLLDRKTAWVLVEEFGHKPVRMTEEEDPEKEILAQQISDAAQTPRSPVVTIMGHVDHGKTSLLDYIRKTRVAASEAGGITQHIGAYQVKNAAGDVTFLDTPGHSLFSQMRARGAQITDIVVLAVAGDDGVKPQTEEAISHAQAAGVPIVAAVNKMDKPGFDLERVKGELSARGVTPEDWGGDAIVVAVSAHTGEGVDALLDAIRTQSDILELKAARDTPAQGAVVEARMDKGRGALTTVIVRQGVLRRNDYVVCGTESGRVRAMWDGARQMLQEATPSMPVEIQGLSGLPEVGEDLIAVADERKAREVAGLRQERRRTKMLSARAAARPAARLLSDGGEEEKRELNVIVKADVGGSREALSAALSAVSGKKAAIKVIHSAVGGVSESDINLARAGDALIVAFNVRPDGKSRKLAQAYGVKILYGNVIYEVLDGAKKAVLDLLDPEREEQVLGAAEVLKVFPISKIGNIAGCRVSEGIIRADARARLVRDGAIVYEGDIDSLRHFKERAEEVKSGEECGIAIRRFGDIKVADVIEAVRIVETPPTL
ncbi:MAG: translation initiation factor IF-2 [Gammaproteobacteria bacterium]